MDTDLLTNVSSFQQIFFFSILWRLFFLVYVVANIKMASAEGLLDLVFDEVNFKPDYSPDSDDKKTRTSSSHFKKENKTVY